MQRAVPLRQLQARLSSELARAAGLLHAWSDRLADGDPDPTRGSGRAAAPGSVEASVAAARARGAPEHWLEVVRAHAPDLLDGGGLRVTSTSPDRALPRHAPPVPPLAMVAAADAPRADPEPFGDGGGDGGGDAGSSDNRSVPAGERGAERVAAPTADADDAAPHPRARRLVHRARRALAEVVAPGGPQERSDPAPRPDRRLAPSRPPAAAPAASIGAGVATTGSARADAPAPARRHRGDADHPVPAFDIESPAGPPGDPATPSPPRAARGDRHPHPPSVAAGRPDGDEPTAGARAGARSAAAVGDLPGRRAGDDGGDRVGSAGHLDGHGARSPAPTATTASAPGFDAPAAVPFDTATLERGPTSHEPHQRHDGPPAAPDPPVSFPVRTVPDDPRDRWPDLPAGSADPRARDHRDRAARSPHPDSRWPALPDEDDRWLVDPGLHLPPPLAAVGGHTVGGAADRDHAAELDAEQRGR